MGIWTSKAPSPHNNIQLNRQSNYGPVPQFTQTTGVLPGSQPDVSIPTTKGYFGNTKAMLNNLPTIFKLSV